MVSSPGPRNMVCLPLCPQGLAKDLALEGFQKKLVVPDSRLGLEAETRGGGSNNLRQVDSPHQLGKMEERGCHGQLSRGRKAQAERRRTDVSQREVVGRDPRQRKKHKQRPGGGFDDP